MQGISTRPGTVAAEDKVATMVKVKTVKEANVILVVMEVDGCVG